MKKLIRHTLIHGTRWGEPYQLKFQNNRGVVISEFEVLPTINFARGCDVYR